MNTPPPMTPDQTVVPLFRGILAEKGLSLPDTARILDMGCGTGRHVHEFVDAGYARTCGFDVLDYVKRRDASDEGRFSFGDRERMSIPHPDGSFDFIYSTSVLEHVKDQGRFFSEAARLLAPGGASIHAYPAKWRPIEPHIFVPLGGAFSSYWYLRLWAGLGIANSFQRAKGLSPRQVAQDNRAFWSWGLHYPEHSEVARLAGEHFSRVSFEEAAFLRHSRGRSNRLLAPLLSFAPWIVHPFRQFHTAVLLLRP